MTVNVATQLLGRAVRRYNGSRFDVWTVEAVFTNKDGHLMVAVSNKHGDLQTWPIAETKTDAGGSPW